MSIFPESDETQKGHMKSQRQGVRSTQEKEQSENEKENDVPEEPKKRHKDVAIKVWDVKEKIFTNQIGKFPFQSVGGHIYLMVMVEVDSNVIDAEPMKNKIGKEHIRAYQELLHRMKSTGVCNPKMHILDNEASKEFQDEIKKQ